jgi:hypothetical protein
MDSSILLLQKSHYTLTTFNAYSSLSAVVKKFLAQMLCEYETGGHVLPRSQTFCWKVKAAIHKYSRSRSAHSIAAEALIFHLALFLPAESDRSPVGSPDQGSLCEEVVNSRDRLHLVREDG